MLQQIKDAAKVLSARTGFFVGCQAGGGYLARACSVYKITDLSNVESTANSVQDGSSVQGTLVSTGQGFAQIDCKIIICKIMNFSAENVEVIKDKIPACHTWNPYISLPQFEY